MFHLHSRKSIRSGRQSVIVNPCSSRGRSLSTDGHRYDAPSMPVGSYRIRPSDPHWPRVFAEEQRRIAEALPLAAERIEHIGSTAVGGLAAKPIIDVMVGIDIPPTSARAGLLLDRLRAIGYVIGGIETVPGTLYCRKAEPH